MDTYMYADSLGVHWRLLEVHWSLPRACIRTMSPAAAGASTRPVDWSFSARGRCQRPFQRSLDVCLRLSLALRCSRCGAAALHAAPARGVRGPAETAGLRAAWRRPERTRRPRGADIRNGYFYSIVNSTICGKFECKLKENSRRQRYCSPTFDLSPFLRSTKAGKGKGEVGGKPSWEQEAGKEG